MGGANPRCNPETRVCPSDRPRFFDNNIDYPLLFSPRNSNISGSFSLILNKPLWAEWVEVKGNLNYSIVFVNLDTNEEWIMETTDTQIKIPQLSSGRYAIVVFTESGERSSSLENNTFLTFEVAGEEEKAVIAEKLRTIPSDLSTDEIVDKKLEICLEFNLLVEAIELLRRLPRLSQEQQELLRNLYADIGPTMGNQPTPTLPNNRDENNGDIF